MIRCFCKIFGCNFNQNSAQTSHEFDDTIRVPREILKKIRNINADLSVSLSLLNTDIKIYDQKCLEIKESLDYLFMNDSINRLLTKKLTLEKFDIKQVVNRIIAALSVFAETKKITLKTTVNFRNNSIIGDAEKLESMIWLCCRRIIEQMDNGSCFEFHAGSEVDIQNEKTRVLFVFNRSPFKSLTTVRDMAFFKDVVKEHNIKFENPKNGNSHLFFSCDLHKAIESSPKHDIYRFLLVDDSPLNLRILSSKMRKYLESTDIKYTIETSGDGKHAFETIKEKSKDYYTMLITDNEMPLMSGIVLCSFLKEEGYKFPIIGISADDSSSFRDGFINAGGSCIFSKPILDSQIPLILSFI